jgi:hypothetical protein
MEQSVYSGELEGSNPIPGNGTPVAYYDYLDADCNLLYQVIRYLPKAFQTRRTNGSGGWSWGMADLEPTLYCLPEVIQANTIVVLEGEKDVHTALSLGLPPGWAATTSPFGAGQWRPAYSELLKGKSVILCPDTDLFGQMHLKQMIFSLLRNAREIKIVHLPGSVKDLSEWVERGGLAAQFADLLHDAEGCPYPISDVELMRDISHLDHALSRVLQLRGAVFEWKDPESQGAMSGPQIGFIAQEVESVFPQWVGSDDNGFRTLSVRGFEALIVESIREIKAKSDQLSSQLSELRATLRNQRC